MKHATFTNRIRVTVGQASCVGLLLAVLMASALLISCAPATDSSGAKPTGYEHLDADEREALADLLADEGEQKLGFSTLNEAWGKFSEARQVDPENKRAEFWQEMLKPLLETKGIVGRMRPLYLSKPGGLDRYTRLVQGIADQSGSDYRRYVTEGPSDIKTDADFRAWMDRIIVSLDTLRTFLKSNKTRTYTLRVPVSFIAGPEPKFEDGGRCKALTLINSKFSGCAESGMLKFKVNRADLEMLQFTVSTQMLQLAAIYAFNINPTAILDNKGGMNAKTIVSRITTGYDGGLFERNRLDLADSVTSDWLTAQQYFIQNQNELCKNGKHSQSNRRGFLISEGVCMDTALGSDDDTTLRMLEMTLLGQAIPVSQEGLTEPVSVYPLKFFHQPPKEILGFMPTAFDETGEASEFNDTVYSPYFAQGSATVLVKAQLAEALRLRNEAAAREARLAAEQREIEANMAKFLAEQEKAKRELDQAKEAALEKKTNSTGPSSFGSTMFPDVHPRERR